MFLKKRAQLKLGLCKILFFNYGIDIKNIIL